MRICTATWHGHCKFDTFNHIFRVTLMNCRDNDIDGIVELTFSVDDEKFGERRTIDLIPGGRDIPVTNENKPQYIE
jgi:hypothetical protein